MACIDGGVFRISSAGVLRDFPARHTSVIPQPCLTTAYDCSPSSAPRGCVLPWNSPPSPPHTLPCGVMAAFFSTGLAGAVDLRTAPFLADPPPRVARRGALRRALGLAAPEGAAWRSPPAPFRAPSATRHFGNAPTKRSTSRQYTSRRSRTGAADAPPVLADGATCTFWGRGCHRRAGDRLCCCVVARSAGGR